MNKYQKNSVHLAQCPLAVMALLVERHSEMLSTAVRKLSRKQVQLAGSKAVRAASVGKSYSCMKSGRCC